MNNGKEVARLRSKDTGRKQKQPQSFQMTYRLYQAGAQSAKKVAQEVHIDYE